MEENEVDFVDDGLPRAIQSVVPWQQLDLMGVEFLLLFRCRYFVLFSADIFTDSYSYAAVALDISSFKLLNTNHAP